MGDAGIILVSFAVKEEAGPFRELTLARRDIQTLITGMGRSNAERAVQTALAAQPIRLVISSGFAGGLNPELAPNTVLFDNESAAELRPALLAAGARPARFHCAERVAVTVAEKRKLREQTGADVVEMESAFIRAACTERDIPSATVRIVLDSATQDLPLDFNRLLDENQNLAAHRVGMALLKAPQKIPALLELRKASERASRRLAEVLLQILSTNAAGPGSAFL